MNDVIQVRVHAALNITPVIREITFEAVDTALPAYSAGSHVQVHIPLAQRTLRNAYSLLNAPADRMAYRIAVRLQEHSRGGSRYLHENLKVGDVLNLSRPANLFPIHTLGRHHILIAGGIGITPFLAYSEHLLREGASFELHYAYRSGLTDAYVQPLAERLGDRLHAYDSLERPLNLAPILSNQPLGSHLYICGPQRLLASVREQASALGWPDGRLHWEAFSSAEPGLPFSVELAQSGRRIEVGADESLLEALEANAVEIPNLCRGGVCGQCVTRYVKGDVTHRDHFLDATERADRLMPCVSRGCGSSLVLDL